MDLQNNKIKMGELLKNPQATAIIKSEFSEFYTPIMIALSRNMTLEGVLSIAAGKVSQERLDRAVAALKEL